MNDKNSQGLPVSCIRLAFSLTVVVCVLPHLEALSQEKVSDYQEIYKGELPIILESGHGGTKDIPSIRPIPNIGGCDKYTLELTRLIRERMIEQTGKSPEMVAMLADRAFIDVNRNPGLEAFRHKFTKNLYQAHYAEIDAALFRVKKRHGTGLMVLIHSGWNYPVQIAIGVNHVEKWCTIPIFVNRHGWDLFHGNAGIGGRLFARGYEVPGFGDTPPGNDATGVPAMTRCRKQYNIGIDGLEFEFQGKTLLADVTKRQELANDIADVLLDFVNQYYTRIPFQKTDGRIATTARKDPDKRSLDTPAAADAPRVRREQPDRDAAEIEAAKWRTWTTSDRKYNVEAKFIKLIAGILTLEKKDGTTLDVKLDLLSSDDRDFVRQRKWAKRASKK